MELSSQYSRISVREENPFLEKYLNWCSAYDVSPEDEESLQIFIAEKDLGVDEYDYIRESLAYVR